MISLFSLQKSLIKCKHLLLPPPGIPKRQARHGSVGILENTLTPWHRQGRIHKHRHGRDIDMPWYLWHRHGRGIDMVEYINAVLEVVLAVCRCLPKTSKVSPPILTHQAHPAHQAHHLQLVLRRARQCRTFPEASLARHMYGCCRPAFWVHVPLRDGATTVE